MDGQSPASAMNLRRHRHSRSVGSYHDDQVIRVTIHDSKMHDGECDCCSFAQCVFAYTLFFVFIVLDNDVTYKKRQIYY